MINAVTLDGVMRAPDAYCACWTMARMVGKEDSSDSLLDAVKRIRRHGEPGFNVTTE